MKLSRPLGLIAALSAVVVATNLIHSTVSGEKFSLTYPPVVCSPLPSGLTGAVSLSSTKMPLRVIGSKSLTLKAAKTLRYTQRDSAVVIDAQGVTPVSFQVRSGKWAGASLCSASTASQWFVGGTADVTTQGKLLLVNSGLSNAVADIEIWNESGSELTRSVTLKADSQATIGLDSLSPGSRELVIHVITRSGRLSAFLSDERGRGLKALGGDLINSVEAPAKIVNIPAIPHLVRSVGKGKTTLSHTLRILNPGEFDAKIDVKVISTDGSFIPVGFENKSIARGKVLSLKLNPNMAPGKFGISISSDQPIVAGVYSDTYAYNKSDFIWSTAAPTLTEFKIAVTGLSPQFIFTGDSVDVTINLAYSNGKRGVERVRGQDIALFQVPEGVASVTFSQIGREIYAGALVSSKSGYGYFPLASGSLLAKSSIPTSNIRVLTP